MAKSSINGLVAIVGPTASGKSALALALAARLQESGVTAEIICADSRTIYRGLNAATAKPTTAERTRVKHHLLDILEPDARYSVADFALAAKTAIDDIRRRGHLPLLVGGSGLYIESVIMNYSFGGRGFKQPKSLLPQTIVLSPLIYRAVLRRRIDERVTDFFAAGLVAETRQLAEKYGWQAPALTGIGYRAVRSHLAGEVTLAQAIADFRRADWQLARRQLTWWRRHNFVVSVADADEALAAIRSTGIIES